MKYTVNSLINRLKELTKKVPQIGDAIVGICVLDEDDDQMWQSAYDLDISEENFCDDTFYIQEVDNVEYDEEDC